MVMKSDREFLDGIYKKAAILEDQKQKKNILYSKLIRFSSVAAIFIILPLLIFNSQLFDPENKIETPSQPKIMISYDPNYIFQMADYILIGNVYRIEKDTVEITIENTLYGEINRDKILIKIEDEGLRYNFIKGSRNLLFLNKVNDNYHLLEDGQFREVDKVFMNSNGDSFDLEDIKNNIERRQLDEEIN